MNSQSHRILTLEIGRHTTCALCSLWARTQFSRDGFTKRVNKKTIASETTGKPSAAYGCVFSVGATLSRRVFRIATFTKYHRDGDLGGALVTVARHNNAKQCGRGKWQANASVGWCRKEARRRDKDRRIPSQRIWTSGRRKRSSVVHCAADVRHWRAPFRGAHCLRLQTTAEVARYKMLRKKGNHFGKN